MYGAKGRVIPALQKGPQWEWSSFTWLNPDRCGCRWGWASFPASVSPFPLARGTGRGSKQPSGGLHSDQRVNSSPLSWGTDDHFLGALWRQFTVEVSSKEKCEQAVIVAHIWAILNNEFRTLLFGPKVSLESSCHLSCPAPGAITTPHHACEVGCPVPILQAPAALMAVWMLLGPGAVGGFAYEMEPYVPKAPQ